ncbi:hypothetical protein ACGFMM_34155 [Streptomyces sp. NPDC048604]|uniref:hypothetical protein n=1 Tax=Streptomyces sp. NPDC048604 TaxID=3365578 RepID=UPI0037109CDB
MSYMGGDSGLSGMWPPGGRDRRAGMPRQLVWARAGLFAQAALALLGTSAVWLGGGEMSARLAGTLMVAALPAVVGAALCRVMWVRGRWVPWAVLGVQVWWFWRLLGFLAEGSWRGVTQLLLPAAIAWLVTRRQVREWFALAPEDRSERPEFSLPHMMMWRRDRGQTSTEYVGLLVVVVAVIGGLLAAGVNTEIGRSFRAVVCSVIGADCGDAGTGDAAAGAPSESRSDPANTSTEAEPASRPKEDDRGALEKGFDWFKDEAAEFGGGIKDKFVEEYYDGPKQLIEGLVDDPLDTADKLVTGVFDEIKRPWAETYDACKQASAGFSVGGVNNCAWKVTGRFTPLGLVDLVVDDDVKNSAEDGNWGRAGGQFVYNGVTTFLPIMKAGKGFSLINKINKKGMGAGRGGESLQKATDAAGEARRAAKAGDLDGAKKAADESQRHADDAAERAAKEGACPLAAGDGRLVPYGGGGGSSLGVAGSGTGIMAGDSVEGQVAVLAAGRGKRGQACQEAQKAQQQADEAKKEAENAATARDKRRAEKIVERAQSGKTRKAPNYHGRLPDDLETDILADPAAVFSSTGTSGRLMFQKDGNIVIVEGRGPRAGQVVTSYGRSGPRGDSGAAIFGGSPTDPGKPVTEEMIAQGKIPTPQGGTLPPGVRIEMKKERNGRHHAR